MGFGIPQQRVDRIALCLSSFFFLAVVARDALLLWGYGMNYAGESGGYIVMGENLLTTAKCWINAPRSIPYPLMAGLTFSGANGLNIIYLQMMIGALAAGILVYTVSKRNLLLGALIGIGFALDTTWGGADKAFLTESSVIGFHLLALAWLIRHFDRRDTIGSAEVFFAGAFYAWAFLIRPSGLLLALPIPFVYFALTRSFRKTSWVIAGFASLILVFSLFGLARMGKFGVLGRSGDFVALPLMQFHLFSPENGPRSEQVDKVLRSCIPDLDYSADFMSQLGTYNKMLACFDPYNDERTAGTDIFLGAYREAILRHPFRYLLSVSREVGRFLTVPTYQEFTRYYEGKWSAVCTYSWCEKALKQRFPIDPGPIMAIEKTLAWTMQIYLVPAVLLGHREAVVMDITNAFPVRYCLLFFAMLLFLSIANRGRERFIAGAAAVFVLYTALSVAAGHVVLARYTVPCSPFYTILSMTTIYSLIRTGVNLKNKIVQKKAQHERSLPTNGI